MDYKVYLFAESSDHFVSQTKQALASQNCTASEISIFKNADQLGQMLSGQDNMLLFCKNQEIDDLIAQNINLLSNERILVDEQVVVFEKAGKKVVFLPVDGEWQASLAKINLNPDRANKQCVFKLFGADQDKIDQILDGLKTQIQDFCCTKYVSGLLKTDLYISYSGANDLIDNSQVQIATAFKDFIYSDNSLDLSQTIFGLASLKNLKLAICEGITGGSLLRQICCKNADAQNILHCGRVEHCKEELTPDNVYKQTLQMLAGCGDEVYAINVQGTYADGQLSIIYALGNQKSIDLHKNTFKLQNRQDAIDFAVNVIMFNIIKKLRQNSLGF